MKTQVLILCFLLNVGSITVAQEKLIVNYSEIEEYVKNNSSEYKTLLNRFISSDSTLTKNEIALVYYGYSFTPQYCGSINNYREIKNKIDNGYLKKAYSQTVKELRKNPVSLLLLRYMYVLEIGYKTNEEQAKKYLDNSLRLFTVIISGGDGKSAQTAFKVICVDDEYEILEALERRKFIKQQSYLKSGHDRFEFKESSLYKETPMYFDISRSMSHLRKYLQNNKS